MIVAHKKSRFNKPYVAGSETLDIRFIETGTCRLGLIEMKISLVDSCMECGTFFLGLRKVKNTMFMY